MEVAWLWILFSTCSAIEEFSSFREFALCPNTPTREIRCDGKDEVIDVLDARIVHAQGTDHCTQPNITKKIEHGSGVICDETLPFTRCHGQKKCYVKLVEKSFKCGHYGDRSPNLFYMKYSCYKFKQETTTELSQLGTKKRVEGKHVDIVSPGFSCPMAEQQGTGNVMCTVTQANIERQGNTLIKIDVEYKLIQFNQSDCLDKIFVRQEGKNNEIGAKCSNATKQREIRNKQVHELIRLPPGNMMIYYEYKAGSVGSKFWIHVKAMNNQAIDVSVTCEYHGNITLSPDQEQLCLVQPSKTAQKPSPTSTTATSTAESVAGAVDQGNASKNMLLYSLVGGVGGFLFFVGMAVIVVFCFVSQRKLNGKDAESNRNKNLYSDVAEANKGNVYSAMDETKKTRSTVSADTGDKNTGPVYSTVDEIEKRKERREDRRAAQNDGNYSYAVVDKTKKWDQMVSRTDTDETVMCENDGVYETSGAAQGNDGGQIAEEEETMMEENTDLYQDSKLRSDN